MWGLTGCGAWDVGLVDGGPQHLIYGGVIWVFKAKHSLEHVFGIQIPILRMYRLLYLCMHNFLIFPPSTYINIIPKKNGVS